MEKKCKEYSSKELLSAFTYDAEKKGNVFSYEIILMVTGAGFTVTNLTNKKQTLYISGDIQTSLTLELKTDSGTFFSATGGDFKNVTIDLNANEKAMGTLSTCISESVFYFDNDGNKETITVTKKILLNEITIGTITLNSSPI